MIELKDCTLYHFPGCPFSERVEILVALRGPDRIPDRDIDISAPRPAWLLEKTGGATALPALETPRGTLLESTAIMRFLDATLPGPALAADDPFRHAIEEMGTTLSGQLSAAGYRMVQNGDPSARASLQEAVDIAFAAIDMFLRRHGSGDGPWLYDRFGWLEAMLTPTMKRLWFLEYYEDYSIPAACTRLIEWREACIAHPATAHHGFEEIVKLYHDYARGAGGGRLVQGRQRSSFSIDPHWTLRPMPPRDKWGPAPSDADLGLT